MLSLISFSACMKCPYKYNRISGVMVSVLDTSAVDRGFEPPDRVKPKTKIDTCCFSTNYALRRKSKDWLARNQDNVSDWVDMSIHGLFR